MLVTSPLKITHSELRVLAAAAKGKINCLYLHWSAGRYDQVFDDYHLSIGEHGEIYQTCRQLTDLKSHTYKRNSNSIGIALCCAYGAILSCKWQPVFAGFAPTPLQVEQMAIVTAILCNELQLEISFSTVKTHAEAALIDGYGPGQNDPDMRWDLLSLSGLPETRALRPGGSLLRERAQLYSRRFVADELLGAPQGEQLQLLEA